MVVWHITAGRTIVNNEVMCGIYGRTIVHHGTLATSIKYGVVKQNLYCKKGSQ